MCELLLSLCGWGHHVVKPDSPGLGLMPPDRLCSAVINTFIRFSPSQLNNVTDNI